MHTAVTRLATSYFVIHSMVTFFTYLRNMEKTSISDTTSPTSSVSPPTTAPASPKVQRAVQAKILGHIGFDSLPEQIVNKSLKNGFQFNILCVGETGIGKSTLMDSLFNTEFEVDPHQHKFGYVYMEPRKYELREGKVMLKLTIVDTVGYGDQVNQSNDCATVIKYIDEQFEHYLQEELKIKRSLDTYEDTRIHVCLYFIRPTGHGLKSLDLMCLRELVKRVNVIPIIAKADAVSPTELEQFKKNIRAELKTLEMKIYNFPTDDEGVAQLNAEMNAHLPFAVVGSSEFALLQGQGNKNANRNVRCRQYPWGIVEVDNEAHNDFSKLRDMMIRTNLHDMHEKTHYYYYELYRQKRLLEIGFSDPDDKSGKMTFQQNCELKKAAFQEELQKREEDMRRNFIDKVKDTEIELKTREKEIYDTFDEQKQDCTREKAHLKENMRQLEEEMQDFQKIKSQVNAQYTSHYSLTLGRKKKS